MNAVTIYSEEFKKQAVQKLLAPGALNLSTTAKNIGVNPSTLFGWRKKYSNVNSMKKSKSSCDWTKEQKLNALIIAGSKTEGELGEYLRANGLNSSDLISFKEECLEGFKTAGRPATDPELVKLRKENSDLEKNLKRKDKALAEMSARVILLKKSHEIWGTPEDDE